MRKWFSDRDIELATDIWITPFFPSGWEAVVGAWDRVWILEGRNNLVWIKDIQHMQGFTKAGSPRTSNVQ